MIMAIEVMPVVIVIVVVVVVVCRRSSGRSSRSRRSNSNSNSGNTHISELAIRHLDTSPFSFLHFHLFILPPHHHPMSITIPLQYFHQLHRIIHHTITPEKHLESQQNTQRVGLKVRLRKTRCLESREIQRRMIS